MVDGSENKSFPSWYFTIGGFSVAFILGMSMLLPIWDNRSGLDILGEMVGGVEEQTIVVGDESPPVDNPAYDYEYFFAEGNIFGSGNTTFKTLNYTTFWNKFKSNSAWQLEAWHPVQEVWVDEWQGTNLNDWLDIERTRATDNHSEKVNLTVTNNHPTQDLYFRFKFGIDARVKSYVNKSSWYEYELTYQANETEDYTVFFNFSDVKPLIEDGKISAKHGIKNIGGDDIFWFMLTQNMSRNPLLSGNSFTIDPNFGQDPVNYDMSITTSASSGSAITHCQNVTLPEVGVVESITIKTVNMATNLEVRCSIWNYVTSTDVGTRIAYTETIDILSSQDNTVITFDFNSPVFLDAGEYYLCVEPLECPDQVNQILGGNEFAGRNFVTDTCPYTNMTASPLTGESFNAYGLWIYGTYGDNYPLISDESPNDDSHNISLSQVVNITVTHGYGTSSTVDFYTSPDASTWTSQQTNHTILNESVSFKYNISDYQTIYYWKVTANDGSLNLTSDDYSFETTPYRTLYFNDTFPNENWIANSLNMTNPFESGWENFTYITSDSAENFSDGFEGTDIDGDITTEGNWNDGGGDYKWKGGDCNTPSGSTGASSCVNGGSRLIYTEASSRYGQDYFLESDTFTGASNITVEFYYHMYGADMGTLKIQIWDGSAWDDLWTLSGQQQTAQADPWREGIVGSDDGDSYPYTDTTKIRIYGLTGTAYTSDICIDNVFINTSTPANLNAWILSDEIFLPDGYSWDALNTYVENNNEWLGIDSDELDAFCGENAPQTAKAGFDGTERWAHQVDHTHWFYIDLGKEYIVTALRGRSETADDPNDITIWISTDNSTWGSPVVSNISDWVNTKSWVEKDITDTVGRYIKAEIYTTEDGIDTLMFGDEDPHMTIFDVKARLKTSEFEPYNNCSFALIDPDDSDYNITSGLVGNGDDISSVTNDSVMLWGNFSDGNISMGSWNISWSSGEAPPAEGTWQTVDDTFNGTFTNTSIWNIISDSFNGVFTNATSWKLVSDSFNGEFSNITYWNTISDTFNGTFLNASGWKTVSDTFNGTFTNTTSWQTISDSFDGTFTNTSTWQIISDTFNGAFSNTTYWNTISDTFNGAFSNTTYWNTISDTFNGTFTNASAWQIISSTFNGTFINASAWQTISDSFDGQFTNTSTWQIISDTFNGAFSNITYWNTIDNTYNGTFTNTSDTITFTPISLIPADILITTTGTGAITYNITTTHSGINGTSVFITHLMNSTEATDPDCKLNTSYILEETNWLVDKYGAGSRDEDYWFEMFNQSGTGEIGWKGQWRVKNDTLTSGFVVNSFDAYHYNFTVTIPIENLFGKIMIGSPPLIRAEDKTDQTFDIYKDNIAKVAFNMSNTCFWDDNQYNNTNYGFHINAAPSAGTNKPLRIYFANDSYTGNPQTSDYTELIGQIQPTDSYEISPSNSNYYHISFSSDENGDVGTVAMTENFSFIFETSQANIGAKWNIYYADDIHDDGDHIHNFNDTNSTFLSTDDGDTYTKTNGTIDTWMAYAKLDSTDEIMYKVYAQTNSSTHGAGQWSTTGTELIDEGNFPPNNPDIVTPNGTSPTDSYNIGETINITYNWLGDPNHETCWVNITVYDNDTDNIVYWLQNRSITDLETHINNTWWYDWDTTGASNGTYYINITVTDPDDETVFGRQNGTFYLVKSWQTISSTFNGTFTNTSVWQTISDTFDGAFSNTTYWNTISDTFNGAFSNITYWNTISDTFNGEFTNTTTWQTISDTFNGEFTNTTSWQTIDNTYNGTFKNTSLNIWRTISSTFNGKFTNISTTILITNPYPTNTSIGNNISITMNVTVNHYNGSMMNISWYYGTTSDNTDTYLGSHNNTYNGTYHMNNPYANSVSTTYYWRVNITDGLGSWKQDIFWYTTGLDAIFIQGYSFNYLPLLGLAIIPFIYIFIKRKKTKGDR